MPPIHEHSARLPAKDEEANASGGLLVLAAAETTVERKGKRVEILAYTGGFMRIGGWGLIAVDLAELEVGAQTPLVASHGERVGDVVGYGRAITRSGQLFVEGTLALVTDAAREVYQLSQAGFAWQASIHVEPLRYERVAAGATRSANGRTLKAEESWTLVTRGRLREISILSIGADAETAVKIAATGRAHGSRSMGETKVDEKDVLDPIEQQRLEAAAETERIAAIDKICGREHPELAGKAIKGGWSVEQTEMETLRARLNTLELDSMRATRPRPPATDASLPQAPATTDVLAGAWLSFFGHDKVGEQMFGAEVMGQAAALHVRSLADLCAHCLITEGRPVPRSTSSVIRAAFSTNALEVALSSTAQKLISDGYADTPPSWKGFANVVSVRDFKTMKVIRPSFSGELEEVGDIGNITHGYLEEENVDVTAKLFGQVLSIGYKSMINDDGGVFASAARELGRNAARKVSDELYTVLLGNAGDFFGTDHNNLLTGANTALSVASLGDAIAAMISQRDANGRDLDIRPKLLLVPPELREAGLQITESESLARYVSETLDNRPEGNPFSSLSLAIEPRLSNDVRFTGTSATAWYIFASPSDAAVNLAFLDGQDTPQIESFGLGDQVDSLAFSWRVYHSLGVGLGDFRAAIKATGTA